jgi:hypothetical protein
MIHIDTGVKHGRRVIRLHPQANTSLSENQAPYKRRIISDKASPSSVASGELVRER